MPIKMLNAASIVAEQMPMLKRWHERKLKIYGDLATSGVFMFPECFWGGNVSIAHCPAFADHIQIVDEGPHEYVWSRSMVIIDEYLRIDPDANCILTTDECTDNVSTEHEIGNTRIFNVINGKSYTNNYGWLWVVDGLKNIQRGGAKSTVTLMHHNIKDLMVDEQNISIKQYRTDLARGLWDCGICDIYGAGFGQSLGQMQWRPLSDKWANCPVRPCPKNQVLANYKFNLCLENSQWPYFVSEKVWQSIAGGCVPIYASDTIWEDFDRDTIIDPRDFPSFEELARFLEGMSQAEYDRRLDGCIDTMMSLLNNDTVQKQCELNVTNFLMDLCG